MNWYVKVIKQYVDFGGRARRREYWMFALFNAIALIVLTVVENLLGLGNSNSSVADGGVSFSANLGILTGIYAVAVLLPSLAVSVRRLHDTGRSGWWLLIGLVPFIGGLVLLVFFFLDGSRGTNRFGADEKAVMAVGPAY